MLRPLRILYSVLDRERVYHFPRRARPASSLTARLPQLRGIPYQPSARPSSPTVKMCRLAEASTLLRLVLFLKTRKRSQCPSVFRSHVFLYGRTATTPCLPGPALSLHMDQTLGGGHLGNGRR